LFRFAAHSFRSAKLIAATVRLQADESKGQKNESLALFGVNKERLLKHNRGSANRKPKVVTDFFRVRDELHTDGCGEKLPLSSAARASFTSRNFFPQNRNR